MSYLTAARAGTSNNGQPSMSESSLSQNYKGIVVSVEHINQEVSWGRGLLGAQASSQLNIELAQHSADGAESKVSETTSLLQLAAIEPAFQEASAANAVHLSGDCVTPTMGEYCVFSFAMRVSPESLSGCACMVVSQSRITFAF